MDTKKLSTDLTSILDDQDVLHNMKLGGTRLTVDKHSSTMTDVTISDMNFGVQSSSDLSAKFDVGDAKSPLQGQVCPTTSTCYMAKYLPTITSVTPDSGYQIGGQEITISGTGFN